MSGQGHNSADARLKAFIDRILRCREAEDEAKEDTKAVYAELKAEGYDKSAAGALVAELRKKDKDADKFAERSAILDLYRDAYERASGTALATHVHAREESDHDTRNEPGAVEAHSAPAGSAPDEIPSANHEHPAPISGDDDGHPGIPSSEADQVNGEGNQGGVSPIIQDAHSEQETASAPQDRNEPVSESGASVEDFQPPAFLKREAAPLRPHCMEPDNCGGYGAKHCHACLKAAGLEA